VTDGFSVDLAGLDAIVKRFTAGIEDLAVAGRTAPLTPTGLGGEAAAAMVTHLLRNAGNLCAGLEDATAGILGAREDYLSVDKGVARRSAALLEAR